jgi:hypothetical protein
VPNFWIASIAPCVSIGQSLNARFDDAQSSSTAVPRTVGTFCPPNCVSERSAGQPLAQNWL